ncbi:MAG: hypothetical protein U7127_10855 [Phormidium sp.]
MSNRFHYQNFQETANFIWEIADEILRDDFKRGKYPDVIGSPVLVVIT